MPVRSLNSPVIKWPDKQTVHAAICAWVKELVRRRKDVLQAGYIGSYARGDWGVGSDVDLVVILESDTNLFGGQTLEPDFMDIPVHVDLLLYSHQEWERLAQEGGRFYQTVQREAEWVYKREPENREKGA